MSQGFSAVAWPSIPTLVFKKTSKGSNPFDVLGVDEEESVMEVVPVVKPKKATLTGWSKVVASSPYPPSYATSGATSDAESTSTSWADMSDDEE